MKYYFTSDVHLGLNLKDKPAKEREKLFINWLDEVEQDLLKNNAPDEGALFLLGDIFDFWLEYKSVVPKQHIKVLAKLESMTSKGIKIYYFKGNHDTWTYDYFESIGISMHYTPEIFTLNGSTFLVGHGHNLILKDTSLGFRLMYSLFNSALILKLYRFFVHADLSNWFGSWWSNSSRVSKPISHVFKGEDEYAVRYSRKKLEDGEKVDYFVFGHLHTPTIYELNEKSKVVILGEWIKNPTYGVFENNTFSLKELGD
ncbi:MAG: UDP-2,3-diacylglucosamine diphosphatase [Rikenellaceae bacterium]